MTDYFFYVVLGLGAGAIIASFATGLLLTYQGSGVVNFAYGAMAMWWQHNGNAMASTMQWQ